MSAVARMLEEFASQPAPTAARLAAAQALREHSLPTRHDENWHYANLRAIEGVSRFSPDPAPATAAGLPVLPAVLAGFERLVLIDGRVHRPASTLAALTLARLRSGEPADAATPFETAGDGRFGLLAQMFAPQPLALRVSGALALEVISITTAAAAASYSDLTLDLDSGAELELVERQLGAATSAPLAEAAAIGCTTLQLRLAAGARLMHTRLQQATGRALLYDTVAAHVAEQASYQLRDLSAGGASARSSVQVQLQGRDASTDIRALAVGHSAQYADALYTVLHEAPGSRSNLVFRGIASERAHVGCSADVQVSAAAPGSRVQQSLRGLIDGKGAEVNLRPRLTINTDDIQAAHGATIGQLDDNLLFYLLSRGLAREAARALLKWAFISEPEQRRPAGAAQSG